MSKPVMPTETIGTSQASRQLFTQPQQPQQPQQHASPPAPIDRLDRETWGQFLQQQRQQQGLTSWRAVAERGQVSLRQVQHLRRGAVLEMRLAAVQRLAHALGLELGELLRAAGAIALPADSPQPDDCPPHSAMDGPEASAGAAPEPALAYPQHQTPDYVPTQAQAHPQPQAPVNWQAECHRLQAQLDRQAEILTHSLQRQALTQLEPWLKNWPKVVHAATVTKPDLLAAKVLPLLAPLEGLLHSWGVEPIGAIGETLAYDPRHHTCVGPVPAEGDPVTVQRPGYRQWTGKGADFGDAQDTGDRPGEVILHRAEVCAGAK
ncbi:MAG: nucleotide exchange factor GrpE [Prochlorothrix sp.]